MFFKKNISFIIFLSFLSCLMQASQQRAVVPMEGAWDKFRDNTFAVTNTATALEIVRKLVNGEMDTYASEAFLGYVLPIFVITKYESNINNGRPNLAAKISTGISALWCLRTLYKVVSPRPVTGIQVVRQGYGS